MSKSRFLYLLQDGSNHICVKDNTHKYPEGTLFFPLSQFSTDDLLKVKAQIASELESRMDYDDVVEKNLIELKGFISTAKGDVIARLLRQTLDRLDQVKADEKRANTRLEILKDEMNIRLRDEGETAKSFKGLVDISLDNKVVYSVGENGWVPVYTDIVVNSLVEQVNSYTDERLEQLELLDAKDVSVKRKLLSDFVRAICCDLQSNGLSRVDSFGVLQKRLTTTTLKSLQEQGLDLPNGIEQLTLKEIKVKRNNK